MNAVVDIQSGVMRIMPENVTPLWAQFEELLRPALVMVSTHTSEDIRRSVMAMRSQLWAQMTDDVVVAAAVTEFVDYPVGMYVRVWLVGARPDHRFDDEAFFEVMDRWRSRNGCVGFEAVGRHGWLRKFPEARIEGLVMRMTP